MLNNANNWPAIIDFAIECIINEAKSFPSFGLVSIKNSGCHHDMDINTFLKSSATFKYFFTKIVQLVINNQQLDFYQLRKLGLEQEKIMLQATNNINTHKGLIFNFGIIFYITIYGLYYHIAFANWSNCIKKLTITLKDDFKQYHCQTNGQKLYACYQISGARGLAMSGYQIVFEDGLIFYQKYVTIYPHLTIDDKHLLMLVFYMANITDTTLISKIGLLASQKIIKMTRKWLVLLEQKGWNHFYEIIIAHNQQLAQQRVSPGGCADLVVVTFFFY